MRKLLLTALLAGFVIIACKKKEDDVIDPGDGHNHSHYILDIPPGLPAMPIPANNPMTEEGIALGRKLFYDPILSGDNTMACADCHKQHFGFSDSTIQFSIGIDRIPGDRNAMPLFNLGYASNFFWDGGAADLESQVIGPIQNPVEMHEDLANVIQELNAHPEYPELFRKAFGSSTVTTPMIMKAIAQFERTMVSGDSKFDRVRRGLDSFTAQEQRGMDLYADPFKGDCVHCHTMGSTFTDFEFRNTGLDSIAADSGRARITLLASDIGKFKTPSLRNIEVTAPYMHDGRFFTLQEVMDHYNTGFHYPQNLDANLRTSVKGRMTQQDMDDIIAFLKTLTDYNFLTNPAFAKP
ncbi:MAG: cytochrome-c peroxidase [Bacteroidetes bacterium]|nr:MAG: cytochrome-c peroxidase [Bacteroidota bacterium]REK05232.1 MAG: cytochrome-c peroxidase [Bacteroidota bacterium]REK32637.1 MAG: cytochrome-c peroxidase [Bacteroidota bacterium]REK48916.1 MAG: cytochrome-c peroxidase [Bacteroidota bacterium]